MKKLARRSWLLGMFGATSAWALGRIPLGGELELSVPFGGRGLDPHASDDVLSALFAAAIADTLFALDQRQRPYPALARGPAEDTSEGATVQLRPGLVSARNRPLSLRDVSWSLNRARQGSAAAILAPIPDPVVRGENLLFKDTTAAALMPALASPGTAIVPRAFSPTRPDGTGAFIASFRGPQLELQRNPRAARGPAFLKSIRVHLGSSLTRVLRDFETGDTDIAWFSSGLHRARADAIKFDTGPLGWIILRTGQEAGPWSAPGIAQQLADSLTPQRLAHLGLRGLPAQSTAITWGGDAVELCVDRSSPYLLEVARVAAALLDASGRVQLTPLEPRELAQRKAQGRYALMVDFARDVGAGGESDPLASLLAASGPRLARRPPQIPNVKPRAISRTLSLGVIGELHIYGAAAPSVQGLGPWELGDVWLRND